MGPEGPRRSGKAHFSFSFFTDVRTKEAYTMTKFQSCKGCQKQIPVKKSGCFLCDRCLVKMGIKNIFRDFLCPKCKDFLAYVSDGNKRSNTIYCGRCNQAYDINAAHLINQLANKYEEA